MLHAEKYPAGAGAYIELQRSADLWFMPLCSVVHIVQRKTCKNLPHIVISLSIFLQIFFHSPVRCSGIPANSANGLYVPYRKANRILFLPREPINNYHQLCYTFLIVFSFMVYPLLFQKLDIFIQFCYKYWDKIKMDIFIQEEKGENYV